MTRVTRIAVDGDEGSHSAPHFPCSLFRVRELMVNALVAADDFIREICVIR